LRNPFDLNINNITQDCKIGTVCVLEYLCVSTGGGGGGMEEIKVRIYGT
jgi:hypothetical protein